MGGDQPSPPRPITTARAELVAPVIEISIIVINEPSVVLDRATHL